MQSPVAAAVLAAAIAAPGAAGAEQPSAFVSNGDVEVATVGNPENWGTTTDVLQTAFAHDFELFQGVAGPMNPTNAGMICASGTCGWLAGLRLPSGASILGIELSACDGDATREIQFTLFRSPRIPAGPTPLLPFQATGVANAPGCATFSATLPTPHTVDNAANLYILDVIETGGGANNWNQFRVRYRLQVSPGPGAASFSDVPTSHPAFRFVEALVAAGITGGCGGGNYCPDAPLTRGQMAVFLSSALGLHFPN
jgi:hypothetical protein